MKFLRTFLLVFVAFHFSVAKADFSGDFDISNWTTSATSYGCGTSTVNTSGAPTTVTFTVANGCAYSQSKLSLASIASSGTISFDYSITGTGTVANHTGSTVVAGTTDTFVTGLTTGATLSGTETVSVSAGQAFDLVLQKNSGFGNTTLTITNFVFTPSVAPTPAAIPTLGEWAMIFMASLMAMFGIRRMRRNK